MSKIIMASFHILRCLKEVGTYVGVNSSFVLNKDIYWIDDVKKIPVDVPVSHY